MVADEAGLQLGGQLDQAGPVGSKVPAAAVTAAPGNFLHVFYHLVLFYFPKC